MKHCIIGKFSEAVTDKAAVFAQIKTLFASADSIEGVKSCTIHENCIARENRYDLMIVVDLPKEALSAWDASELHHQWKAQFGGLLAAKAIFDYED